MSYSTLRCILSFSTGFSLSLGRPQPWSFSLALRLSLSFLLGLSIIPPCPSFPCNLPQCVTTGPRATESQRDARARPCLYSVLVAFLCRVRRVLIGARCNINYARDRSHGPRAPRNFYPGRVGCSTGGWEVSFLNSADWNAESVRRRVCWPLRLRSVNTLPETETYGQPYTLGLDSGF